MVIETVPMGQTSQIVPIDLNVAPTGSNVPMDLVVSQRDGFAMENRNAEMEVMKWDVHKKV